MVSVLGILFIGEPPEEVLDKEAYISSVQSLQEFLYWNLELTGWPIAADGVAFLECGDLSPLLSARLDAALAYRITP